MGINSAQSNFIGYLAGAYADGISNSNFIGYFAGSGSSGSSDSNFIGDYAGAVAPGVSGSNFIGLYAGCSGYSGHDCNFIGTSAGFLAFGINYSNFIGYAAGASASGAMNSIFIGTYAGSGDTVDNIGNSGSTSIAIGRKAGTGGYSDSIAIGHGVINGTSGQANIGNVLQIVGIYKTDTQSSTLKTDAITTIGGRVNQSNGNFVDIGDAQYSRVIVRNVTSDGTQTELFIDGSSLQITIPSNCTYTYDIDVAAYDIGAGNVGGWNIKGTIKNVAGTVTASTPASTTLYADDAVWAVTTQADNTNKALQVLVTGKAATDIRWVATVHFTIAGKFS